MRIAGIYPQLLETDPKIQHAVGEPYSMEIILAIAKQEGHDVDLFTCAIEQQGNIQFIDEKKLLQNIIDFKPDIAAFSMYTCQYPMGKRIAIELKKKFPGIITLAGNRYPTFLKENIEEPFDFFIIKEGETSFKELLYEIENGRNFKEVKGITYKKDGEKVFTGIRERILNLDSLPNALRFPVILKQIYRGVSLPPLSENPHFAIVEYSRCCYNNCKFCDNTGFWGNRVAFRSAKKVVDEMFELKEKGVDLFYFMDLNFTANTEKTKELCNEMIKRSLNASWYCMSNIATIEGNEELLYLMKKAGCYRIAWGVESTNDNSLKKMNKTVKGELTTNELTIKILNASLNVGIINQGFYIIGFPWDSEESILKDAEEIKKLPLHQLNIGIFTPIPLSRFYNDMEKEYEFDPDLQKHDRNTLIFNHKSLTNEKIKILQKKLHSEFYESKEYLERIKKSCTIDRRFIQMFNDYFKFLGKEIKV